MSSSHSRRSSVLLVLLGGISVAIVAGILGATGVFDGSDPKGGAANAQTQTNASPPAGTGGSPASVADIYEKVSPGVVFVSARSNRGSLEFLGPEGGRASSGSGFVIDAKGNVVTNQHVVDGSRDVRVRFGEDGEPIRARVVGEDPSTDIALLKIDPKEVEGGIKPLSLGGSEGLRPGETTIAIGAPFGLAGTVTTGIVSALEREIQSPNGFPIAGVVQTDAAINPGNSGGPLLDGEGRVIGVNSQIAAQPGPGGSASNSGVGFAVPIDTVKEVVPLLERDGKVDRPYVGVSTSEAPGAAGGAVVRTVVPRGPALKAGLRTGDRITRIGETKIDKPEDIATAIEKRKPGERVEVRYVRSSGERTATVELGTRPTESRQQQP